MPSAGVLTSQALDGAPPLLRGDGQRPELLEGAGVEKVVQVLARGPLPGPAAARDGVGAVLVEGQGGASPHLGEVGPDQLEVDLFGVEGMLGGLARLDEGQRRALIQGVSHRGGEAVQQARDRSGHHVLHLHSFQHRHRLPGGDGDALGDLQAHDGASERRGGGLRARRRRDPRARRRRCGLGDGLGRQFRGPRQQLRQVVFEEAGVRPALDELGALQHRLQQRQRAGRPFDPELGGGPGGPGGRCGQGRPLHDELGDQESKAGLVR